MWVGRRKTTMGSIFVHTMKEYLCPPFCIVFSSRDFVIFVISIHRLLFLGATAPWHAIGPAFVFQLTNNYLASPPLTRNLQSRGWRVTIFVPVATPSSTCNRVCIFPSCNWACVLFSNPSCKCMLDSQVGFWFVIVPVASSLPTHKWYRSFV